MSSHVELHVFDFAPAKEFYPKLGFTLEWEQAPEDKRGYLVFSLEKNIIAFWCGNEQVYGQSHFQQFPADTPVGFGVEIVLIVPDIAATYERISGVAPTAGVLAERPWGLPDFRIVDPYGFYLRFSPAHDPKVPRISK